MKEWKVTLKVVSDIAQHYEQKVEADMPGEAMDIALAQVPRHCMVIGCVPLKGDGK